MKKLEYSKPTLEYINGIESSNSRVVQADVVYDVNYAFGQNILLAVTVVAGFQVIVIPGVNPNLEGLNTHGC